MNVHSHHWSLSDMDMEDLHSLLDYIRWCCSAFDSHDLNFGHGTDNPWDEACALVLGALHLPPDLHQLHWAARLTQSEKKHLQSLIEDRIKKRTPVAYLLNSAWYRGFQFEVNPQVLIPRSPMGQLIENHLEPWLKTDPRNILDVCTGSGCLAILLAYYFPNAQVYAGDISQDALAVAARNIKRHGLADHIVLKHCSVFEGFYDETFQPLVFDLILCNPPYVSQDDMHQSPLEFHHEPKLALTSGYDGLDLVKHIILEAPKHLNNGGILLLEVGASKTTLERTFSNFPFMWVDLPEGGEGVLVLDKASCQILSTVIEAKV